MRRKAEAELRGGVNQRGMHSAQGFRAEILPELIVVTQVPGVDADSSCLGRALEPGRAHQRAVFRGQGLEIGKLRRGSDLRRVFPVFQLRPGFAAGTGDQALVRVPSCRKGRIGEPLGLRQGDRAVKDFGPAAVRSVEDLLVDFPSRLGDVRPPFAELGVLQVAVHVIFLPQRFFSRSVLLPSSGQCERGIGHHQTPATAASAPGVLARVRWPSRRTACFQVSALCRQAGAVTLAEVRDSPLMSRACASYSSFFGAVFRASPILVPRRQAWMGFDGKYGRHHLGEP